MQEPKILSYFPRDVYTQNKLGNFSKFYEMYTTLTNIAIVSLTNHNYINMQVYTTTHSDNIYGMPFHLNTQK